MELNRLNPIKNRNFIDISSVSQHLICTICLDIYRDPCRVSCGHTFCRECLVNWFEKSSKCPNCRCLTSKAKLGKDLIAENLISELLVRCSSSNCPWVGILQDLYYHLEHCEFKHLPGYIQDMMENKEQVKNEEDLYAAGINTSAGLFSRLYQKKKEVMERTCGLKTQPINQPNPEDSFDNFLGNFFPIQYSTKKNSAQARQKLVICREPFNSFSFQMPRLQPGKKKKKPKGYKSEAITTANKITSSDTITFQFLCISLYCSSTASSLRQYTIQNPMRSILVKQFPQRQKQPLNLFNVSEESNKPKVNKRKSYLKSNKENKKDKFGKNKSTGGNPK